MAKSRRRIYLAAALSCVLVSCAAFVDFGGFDTSGGEKIVTVIAEGGELDQTAPSFDGGSPVDTGADSRGMYERCPDGGLGCFQVNCGTAATGEPPRR